MDISKRKERKARTGSPDQLALQNAIRSRYTQNWPNVILHLTTRIQSMNDRFQRLVKKLLFTEGLIFEMYRDGDNFVLRFRRNERVETHKISIEKVQDALPHIEVMILDRLERSELLADG